MAYLTAFEKKLDQLFFDRTYELRSKLGMKKPGPKPHLTKGKIDKAIHDLQHLVSNSLAKDYQEKEFKKNAGHKKRRKIIGKGWKNRKKAFEQWFKKNFRKQNELVYVFWNKKRCVYVGRTGKGGSRPSSHFSKIWCHVTWIDLYPVKSETNLPKLECLAVHRFKPSVNTNLPSKKKWTKKCPLCDIHNQIKADLKKIFKIK